MPEKKNRKKRFRFMRIGKIRAYLLIKSIRKQLKEQERKTGSR